MDESQKSMGEQLVRSWQVNAEIVDIVSEFIRNEIDHLPLRFDCKINSDQMRLSVKDDSRSDDFFIGTLWAKGQHKIYIYRNGVELDQKNIPICSVFDKSSIHTDVYSFLEKWFSQCLNTRNLPPESMVSKTFNNRSVVKLYDNEYSWSKSSEGTSLALTR